MVMVLCSVFVSFSCCCCKSHDIVFETNLYASLPLKLCFHHITAQWGVSTIHVLSVIASRKGLSELLKYHPDVHVTIGHVDEALNEEGDLVPGLGDAGDRLFGTTHPSILEGGGEDGSEELEDQELVHFSKRKRTMSVDAGN